RDERHNGDEQHEERDERRERERPGDRQPHRGALVRLDELRDLLTGQLELLADVPAHVVAETTAERAITGTFVHGARLYRRQAHRADGARFLPEAGKTGGRRSSPDRAIIAEDGGKREE